MSQTYTSESKGDSKAVLTTKSSAYASHVLVPTNPASMDIDLIGVDSTQIDLQASFSVRLKTGQCKITVNPRALHIITLYLRKATKGPMETMSLVFGNPMVYTVKSVGTNVPDTVSEYVAGQTHHISYTHDHDTVVTLVWVSDTQWVVNVEQTTQIGLHLLGNLEPNKLQLVDTHDTFLIGGEINTIYLPVTPQRASVNLFFTDINNYMDPQDIFTSAGEEVFEQFLEIHSGLRRINAFIVCSDGTVYLTNKLKITIPIMYSDGIVASYNVFGMLYTMFVLSPHTNKVTITGSN